MPWSLRLLRAFLGVTFVFAGAQKLFDPNFLKAGSPDYIGTQLRGFAQGTPVAPLMTFLAHVPVLTGIGIAVVEIAVGIGTLLGAGMLLAAIAGFAINATLLLSATWHVHPYFLGSDSIYAVAWLALAAGIVEVEREHRGGRVAGPIERIDGIGRRELVRGGLVAGVALVLATGARALAGPPAKGAEGIGKSTPPPTLSGGSTGKGKFDGPVASGGTTQTATKAQGTVITTLDQLPVGKAVGFSDPSVGPAVLLRLSNNEVLAYSRVCTHAGCLVGYDQGSQILVCPCHGAEFDPAHGAEAIAGPTNTPLQSIRVVVDKSSGQVILPG